MMNVLLVAPDHVGIIKLIREQLQGNKEYDLDVIDLVLPRSEKFRYKSTGQRVRNFFIKTFTKKNLKEEYYHQKITEKITNSKKRYDVVVTIRPDLLRENNLKLLRSLTTHFVAYYWDTVSFYPRKREIIHFFDRIFSFDVEDCSTFGFEFLTNFYCFVDDPAERKYDVYGIVMYDERAPKLEKVAAFLEAKNISYCIKANAKKDFNSKYITWVPQTLDYRKMLKEISFCEVLLEIQKDRQKGLSFRPFEALGMKKKLITNNPLIKQYDFYSDHNICVIDPDNINIPEDFFATPYRDIDPRIRDKYHFKHWFDKLVSPVPVNFAENG